MHIQFNIYYRITKDAIICLNIKQADGSVLCLRMTSGDNEHWQYELTDVHNVAAGQRYLNYYYTLQDEEEVIRREWAFESHCLNIAQRDILHYVVNDIWQTPPLDAHLYTTAFHDNLNKRELKSETDRKGARLRLKVRAPQLRSGERLIMTGNHPVIGEWQTVRGVPCIEQSTNEWVCNIDVAYLANETIELKFLAVDDAGSVMWEIGENRLITVPRLRGGEVIEHEMLPAYFEIPNERLAGTMVPVYALRNHGSMGIGDFGDLKRMIDWIADTQQRLLYILPVNDIITDFNFLDVNPYLPVSSYALNMLYMDLRQLPNFLDGNKKDTFASMQQSLNEFQKVDYEQVYNAKQRYLRLLFAQEGETVLASKECQYWMKEQEWWLVPYARYAYLRESHGTADFHKWSDENTWNEAERMRLTDKSTKEYHDVAFFYYVQYRLAQQLRSVYDYAVRKKVILRCDIPLGVHQHACDVWQAQQYFSIKRPLAAQPEQHCMPGLPPGFSIPMGKDVAKKRGRKVVNAATVYCHKDSEWYVKRLRYMSQYFDAYALQHVDSTEFLSAQLASTRMLPCVADAGALPEELDKILDEQRVLSLEVLAVSKQYGMKFSLPQYHNYRSICMLSIYGAPTLREWWEEDSVRTQEYYSAVLGRRDAAPHPLPSWLARDIIMRYMQSPSMICILPLQDWLMMNAKQRGSKSFCRMPLCIDDMLQDKRFCDDVAEVITQSDRQKVVK